MSFLAVGLIALAIALWFILGWREKKRVEAGQPRLSGIRLVFAALGLTTVLFSGGCGSILGFMELTRARSGAADDFMSWELVAIFSVPPLLVGLLIWWLSMRRAKG